MTVAPAAPTAVAVTQPDGRIPFRLRIGVTGHRSGFDEAAVADRIRHAVERIGQLVPSTDDTPVLLRVVSSLAEGADRLVATAVLAHPGADLEVVLPLPALRYRDDFTSEASKLEFDAFCAAAREVVQAPPAQSPEEAYELAGRYVVGRCDVLVAVWNEKDAQGRGGTAEIVEYARKRKVPVLWVKPGRDEVVEERTDAIAAASLAEARAYNGAHVGERRLREAMVEEGGYLLPKEPESIVGSLPHAAVADWVLPYFVRADRLALRYQRWYLGLGLLLFSSAALAVMAAAGKALFWEPSDWPVKAEILLLSLLALIVVGGRQFHLHPRWISNRFLAERFRSGFYLGLAALGDRREGGFGRADPGDPAQDWARRAFAEVWQTRPPIHLAPADVEALRTVLVGGWLEGQIVFHERRRKEFEFWHSASEACIWVLLGIAVLAAYLHLRGAGGDEWENRLSFVSVAVPAIGAAVTGAVAQREYRPHAKRYEAVVSQLKSIKARAEGAGSLEALQALAGDTEQVMLTENRDWFGLVIFHDFELHV